MDETRHPKTPEVRRAVEVAFRRGFHVGYLTSVDDIRGSDASPALGPGRLEALRQIAHAALVAWRDAGHEAEEPDMRALLANRAP